MATTPGGRLILVCGLAGAGKTTVAKELEAEARQRVEAALWELAQSLVLRGLTVVDECGVWQRWERDLRREWARGQGVSVELRFLDAPVEELTARIAARNAALPTDAQRIDPALVAYWDTTIERPDAAELALFD